MSCGRNWPPPNHSAYGRYRLGVSCFTVLEHLQKPAKRPDNVLGRQMTYSKSTRLIEYCSAILSWTDKKPFLHAIFLFSFPAQVITKDEKRCRFHKIKAQTQLVIIPFRTNVGSKAKRRTASNTFPLAEDRWHGAFPGTGQGSDNRRGHIFGSIRSGQRYFTTETSEFSQQKRYLWSFTIVILNNMIRNGHTLPRINKLDTREVLSLAELPLTRKNVHIPKCSSKYHVTFFVSRPDILRLPI